MTNRLPSVLEVRGEGHRRDTDTSPHAALIRAARRQPRVSDLRLWVEANYAELATAPNDWVVLASELNGQGMRDAYGRKLNARMLAKAYSRVKAAREPAAAAVPASRPESFVVRSEAADSGINEPFVIRSINRKETPP